MTSVPDVVGDGTEVVGNGGTLDSLAPESVTKC
jgi:hypothetical protein